VHIVVSATSLSYSSNKKRTRIAYEKDASSVLKSRNIIPVVTFKSLKSVIETSAVKYMPKQYQLNRVLIYASRAKNTRVVDHLLISYEIAVPRLSDLR
jgi:hypothetical protein